MVVVFNVIRVWPFSVYQMKYFRYEDLEKSRLILSVAQTSESGSTAPPAG